MRICLWAGAGAGKSTLAAGLFAELKKRNISVELVNEYIKKWVYENKVPQSFDQIYVMGKQINFEDVLLRSGVQNIVTDSPIGLQTFYARQHNFVCWPQCLQISREFDRVFKPLHIFLDRTGIVYQQNGRWGDEESSKRNDTDMRNYLEEFIGDYHTFKTTDFDGIVSFVTSQIENSGV